jgi:hypothetical protein
MAMKNYYLLRIALGLALLLAAPQLWAQDTYTFTLLPPNGNVFGPPGSTVGWGYTIINNSDTYWLVTSGLNADTFLDGTPNPIFDFPDLAPDATDTVPFDPSAITPGLYELTWDPTAPVDFVNSGNFDLSAQWYSGDPLNGGQFVSNALDEFQPYSATVTVAVPEPAILALLLTGLIGIGALRKSITA